MHLSKKALYVGIIAYCVALLIFQDWGSMTASVGTVSAAWLGKMLFDIGLACAAGVRLAGPSLFAEEEETDEVALHEEDLHISDTALFGVFMLNIIGNLAYHAYATVMTTGAVSFYFSMWVIAEAVALFLSYVLFSHARKTQRKLARQQRTESKQFRQVG